VPSRKHFSNNPSFLRSGSNLGRWNRYVNVSSAPITGVKTRPRKTEQKIMLQNSQARHVQLGWSCSLQLNRPPPLQTRKCGSSPVQQRAWKAQAFQTTAVKIENSYPRNVGTTHNFYKDTILPHQMLITTNGPLFRSAEIFAVILLHCAANWLISMLRIRLKIWKEEEKK